MRRPAYDSNVAFEGKIKSMRLISEMIGLDRCLLQIVRSNSG